MDTNNDRLGVGGEMVSSKTRTEQETQKVEEMKNDNYIRGKIFFNAANGRKGFLFVVSSSG